MAVEKTKEETAEPRPFWSGTLTFGLVSLPVEIYPAVRSQRVSLRMIGPNGVPLKRRYYCTADGKELTSKDIVRGYEQDNGEYVVVTDKELKALAPRKSRDIDLRRFVDRGSIPVRMLEQPYFLAPGGESTRAYHLLAETMEQTNRAGIATFVMRGREHLAAIFAESGVLLAATLRFVEELRTPEEIGLPEISAAPLKRKKEIESALKKLSSRKLDLDLFRDERAAALLKLAEQKRDAADDIVEFTDEAVDDEEEASNVIDIMSLLKKRIEEERNRPGGNSESKSTSVKRVVDDLEQKSKEELYGRAQELDLAGRSGMSKSELIAAIRSAA